MIKIWNFHKHSDLVKVNQDVIGIIVQGKVQPMIVVDNTIHSIININLLIITNVNSIIMI